jgi:hypothetical protein
MPRRPATAAPARAPSRSAAVRRQLVADMQYLNLAEMRAFCQRHRLPLYIHVQDEGDRVRRTGDRDRKDVVLARMFAFVWHGRREGPTVYPRQVVATGPLPARPDANTRIRYGQYEKQNAAFVARMRQLTDGEFRLGMIARLVLRDFWTAGRAPTLRQFALAWRAATAAHTAPRPEGAYLVDLAKGQAGAGWKQLRIDRARRALAAMRALVGG